MRLLTGYFDESLQELFLILHGIHGVGVAVPLYIGPIVSVGGRGVFVGSGFIVGVAEGYEGGGSFGNKIT